MIPPIAYIVMIALVMGFGGGYKTKSVIVSAETASVLQAERDKLIAAQETNKNLQNQLVTAQAETKIIYKTVVKKVPEYVTVKQKTDGVCNLSRGAKRLFNETINPLSDTSSGTTTDDSTASDIREIDLIHYSLNLIQYYKLAQSQCNLLVKWHGGN